MYIHMRMMVVPHQNDIHVHTCDNILILEILYHYQDIIAIIDIISIAYH